MSMNGRIIEDVAEVSSQKGESVKHRIIIAGGGTGGHIFPAVAIANALIEKESGCEILFVGAKGKMEMEKVPQSGYNIIGIDIAGFNRSSLIKNIGLPFKLIKSFLQVRKILKKYKPDAVIGVGGYSSFPVLRSAQAKGIPTFIHESNSFAGKSNILLGKKATAIFVATDGMQKFFPANKILITGNPVRSRLVNAVVSRKDALKFFNLEPGRQTVLVTGGSLGAKGINEAIDAKLEEFEQNNIQLIWQTGKSFAQRAKERSKDMKGIWTGEFIKDMEYGFAASDVVVSRAGAMAIAELCVAKKPVVFVPYPFAAEDHQTVNAKTLVDKRAGLMIADKEAKGQLVDKVIELVKNDEAKKELSAAIEKFAITNADKRIAGDVLKRLREKQ